MDIHIACSEITLNHISIDQRNEHVFVKILNWFINGLPYIFYSRQIKIFIQLGKKIKIVQGSKNIRHRLPSPAYNHNPKPFLFDISKMLYLASILAWDLHPAEVWTVFILCLYEGSGSGPRAAHTEIQYSSRLSLKGSGE